MSLVNAPGGHTSKVWQKQGGDLTFLFWNLNAKNLLLSIVRLVEQHNVDVLILAECELPIADILRGLNPADQPAQFEYALTTCERIMILTRFPAAFIMPLVESDRYTIRSLRLPGDDELLFVAAHLLSLKEVTEKTLYGEVEHFAAEIRRVEAEQKHARTLLVGDLNLNPFSDGLVSATGLHAVMSQSIANRITRTVQKRAYPFFYNPMWRLMCEHYDPQTETYSPPGTYYYAGSDHVCYFWNTFDQVLLRPGLLNRWDDQRLQIVTTDNVVDFLSQRNRLPGGVHRSDHLPIVFQLMSSIERNAL